jgi:hypothetical protein
MFFPLGVDGLPVDRSARLALGVSSLDARANNYGPGRFNRPGHTVLADGRRLFASDFQGSRIMVFDLPNLAATTGRAALEPLPKVPPPEGRPFLRREEFELQSVQSGTPAAHVLGQVDFYTGLRDTASQRQMGKEISGLAYDRDRRWLFVAEKLNHRLLVVDVSNKVETFMPAMAVLGQDDFDHNAPQLGHGSWHARGLTLPSGVCYDHPTKMLFTVSGEGSEREILGFDLSGKISNGLEPAVRIGGPHATVQSDLPRVERLLSLDEKHRRLWNGLYALDLSGDIRNRVPLVGWFGLGAHPDVDKEQDNNSGKTPSLLGYSVGFCDRFGGAVSALAVNPRSGTVYVADSPRYRVLCYQPRLSFRADPIALRVGQPACEFTASGGLAPLRFSIVEGKLPAGLELDARSGLVRGVARGEPGESTIELAAQTATGTIRGKLRLLLAGE